MRPRRASFIVWLAFVGVFAFAGCADKNGSGPCGWLYAPLSFTDAGSSTCEAEPAGSHCDTTTERCPAVCEPNEYVLTCRTSDVPQAGVTNRGPQDPTVTDIEVSCTPLHVRQDGGVVETTYCCHCER
ncbi:MAG: hypothetical protein ABW133_00400 [Polyangiaceae bacterium]